MQDRLKFRVWDKENKCMYYPTRYSNFTIVNGTVVKIESYPIANSAYLGKRIALEFDAAVIIQCTGFKDKNGKLIYEGDICKYKFEEIGEQKAIIYFNKELCSFLAKPLNDFQYTRINNCEVIGNIYENKELLNESSN